MPAKAELLGDVFDQYVAYLRTTNGFVEETYKLDKAGAFHGRGDAGGEGVCRCSAGCWE